MVTKRNRARTRRVARVAAAEAGTAAVSEAGGIEGAAESEAREAGGDASTATVEENMGVLVSTSEQEIASLTAEADAALSAAPPAVEPGAHVEGAPELSAAIDEMARAEEIAKHYVTGCYVAVNAVANVVAPNWNVEAAEKKELAEASALALALWFPDLQIPPKYMALFAVAGIVWGIGAKRFDQKTGRLIPLRVDANPDGAQAT